MSAIAVFEVARGLLGEGGDADVADVVAFDAERTLRDRDDLADDRDVDRLRLRPRAGW